MKKPMYVGSGTFMRFIFGLAIFSVSFVCHAQTMVIPQVVDGGGWRTTIVLTNTSATPASASLSFYMETTGGATQSWNPPFLETSSTQSLSLPGAGTIFLHTPGTSSVNSAGWGLLQASTSVVAYSVFTISSPGGTEQNGNSPALVGTPRLLIPFDNTGNLTTAVALANPSATSEPVAVSIQYADGSNSAASFQALPALGHLSFLLPSQFPQTSGKAGIAEFYTSGGQLAGIGLLADATGGFFSLSSSPIYGGTGSPIIVVNTTIQSVTLSPTSVTGGQSAQGTVVLANAAPAGGAVVSLSSSSSAAMVPATITIPAGSTSGTFTVNTNAVSSAQTATVTATYLSNSATATLSIVPQTQQAFSNLICAVTFQPVGYPSGNGNISVDPDPGSPTFSALAFAVGTETQINLAFSGGAATNGGNTFAFKTLSATGAFYSGSIELTVSSGSLNFTLSPTSSSATYVSGTVAGTFTMTGMPVGGGNAVLVGGSISGTYYAPTQ